jgi:hypothetical protein
VGRLTCALNIDTLAHRWQQGIQFIGVAEMLTFMRQALAGYQVNHFPRPTVTVTEQITPWTEVYNYTYFGIPSIQPRFKTEDDFVRTTVYHTQLDEASLVDVAGAAEILKLYGMLLILLDQQPNVPYNFNDRAQSIRNSLNREMTTRFGLETEALEQALAAFETWAVEIRQGFEQQTPATLAAFNDHLREVARRLLPGLYYVETDFPDSGTYEHLLWQREALALDRAVTCLAQGQVGPAIAALTDPQTGVQGGWYALNVSYPVYYRCIVAARNPARSDLLWGEGRTIPLNDVWGLSHTLQDKQQRGLTDFTPELFTLQEKRAAAVAGYREALEKLRGMLLEIVKWEGR